MAEQKLEKATFAGGCFWCLQGPYDTTQGVIATRVGYIGGTMANPTYEQVSSGHTGHAEAIQVLFDPSQVGYRQLLEIFWRNIDPTTKNRQFADVGTQYRTAIFYHNENQHRMAEETKQELDKSGQYDKPIVTEIVPATEFYEAEDYHQEYYKKHPTRYNLYKWGSGRGPYIKDKWGDDQSH